MCVDYHMVLRHWRIRVMSHGFNMKMGQKACIRSTEGKFTE